MTMIYVDADLNVAAPVNDPLRNDLENWLGGAAPGPIPDGGLNPVLFSRDQRFEQRFGEVGDVTDLAWQSPDAPELDLGLP